MPTRLDRATFVSTLEATPVPLEQLEQNATLKGVVPFKADLDGNGVIHGANEYDRLFTQIDSYGRGADAQSTALVGPDGKATQSALALRELAKLTDSRDVLGWTTGIDFSAVDDLSQVRSSEKGTPAAVVAAAATLVREHKHNYGTQDPWFNLDPKHSLPMNVPLRGLGRTDANPAGHYKCNLFLGNTLAVAGFEPPYYGNRGSGEYANANQFYKFSDKYAAQYGNKVHFKMVAEVETAGLDSQTVRERVAAALRQAQPGDLILVDHQGDEVSDGGHGRVLLKNDLREDGSGELHAAQAAWAEGTIRREGLSSFTGEEKVWILRPTLRREEKPQSQQAQSQSQSQAQSQQVQTQQVQPQTRKPAPSQAVPTQRPVAQPVPPATSQRPSFWLSRLAGRFVPVPR